MKRTVSLSVFLLVIALVGSAGLAYIKLRSATIWFDEAITLMTVAGHSLPDWSSGASQFVGSSSPSQILIDLYRIDVHPPLYFWTVAAWRTVAGSSLESIRILSALFMLASIWLLYRVAEGFAIKRPGVVACIYAFSSTAVAYSYTARSYSMALFLIILTLYLAQRKSIWAGVAAAASIATHYFSALCVGPILLCYFISGWKENRRWTVQTAILFTACIAPLVPMVLMHFGARPAQYIAPASALMELKAAVKHSLAASFPTSLTGWLTKTSWIALGICALAGAIQASRTRQWVLWFAPAAFIAGFLLMALASHKSITAMPGAYYFGMIVPPMALLIAVGIEVIPPMLAVIAALLVTTWAMPMLPVIPAPDSANYRAIIATIRPHCERCVLVAGIGSGRGVPGSVTYEAKGLPVLVLDRNVDQIVAQAGQYQRIYFFPANEGRGVADEEALVQRLRLQPISGYFESPP